MLQSLLWLLFAALLFILMCVVMPRRALAKLIRFGLWMGIVQAVIILFLGQTVFKLFRINGDPAPAGIPVFASLSWYPAAVIFAHLSSGIHTAVRRVELVAAFALGTTATQLLLSRLGMWMNLRWNAFYTLTLAIMTHSLMTWYWLARYARRFRSV